MNPSENQIKRSLRFSFLDGIFASCMIGFTQEYFTPFLLVLGASVKHVGILNALPNLSASLTQLKSADFVEKVKSRKKIIVTFVLLQALMLLPIMFIALANVRNLHFFIMIVILFTSFGALANPAWGSLMSDLVDENKRGEYFGFRTRILGFITVMSIFIAGIILNYSRKTNVFLGFASIFGLAFLFRMISCYFLNRMHDASLEHREEDKFTFLNFLSRMRESNFAKFVLFVSMMNFSVNLASPFFAVLMLRDLHFNYLLYTFITLTATLTVYIIIGRWGKHADKVGNLKIIRFVSPLIGILPLLWVINRSPVFLLFAQVVSGFAWAGFNLCASNFIYDAVIPTKRTRCIAYFNFLNGIALCAGALLGGFTLQKLPPIFGYNILTLFLISSFLRLMFGIFMPTKLREVRPVTKVGNNQLFFSVIGIRPLLGIERKTIRY